ncbi:hypothetical protein A0H81_02319 [Grifola frondosa]|uniref:Uncharacterized protein n=1 Tax=Grifola frondosa TaxID=5627 RepID=A0A1C7MKL2_GRIFR|nr:hypothetical protein A0H81_02319 [Grifola frondosa]
MIPEAAGKISRQARELVLSILAKEKLTTQQLWKAVAKREIELPPNREWTAPTRPGSNPPYPSHHIPSLTFLKRIVLPALARGTRDITKVHSKKTLTEEEQQQRLASMTKAARKASKIQTSIDVWEWQLNPDKPVQVQRKVEEVKTVPFGAEVGVGEDFSHLNKRRQRARAKSVTRDVAWMKVLQAAKAEGASVASSGQS